MADRKQFIESSPVDPELANLLRAAKEKGVTEEQLQEQRISFAFGNAPADSDGTITKETVRRASESVRLIA